MRTAWCVMAAMTLTGAGCATREGSPLLDWIRSERAIEGSRRPLVEPLPPGPLTLDQAIFLALERNPDLRAAAERIGAAEAHVTVAASAFYPQFGARLSYGR